MLEIQKYLRSGKSLDELANELGVKSYRHPSLPLVGLKYSQIESPKTDPIVRECRGLVLEDQSWNVIAKPFNRFFNAGEHEEEFNRFNWNNFTATTKEDGSLIIVYWYNGEWHANTSGSFGFGDCGWSNKSFREVFWDTYGTPRNKPTELTYVFELCTNYNKVVRTYPTPSVFLLSAFLTAECRELKEHTVDELAKGIGAVRPQRHLFQSMNCIREFVAEMEERDKTFEGIVIRDDQDIRFKIKSKTYLALHRLADNGNIANPKNLVPLVLAGETGEVIAYFPELKDQIETVDRAVNEEYRRLEEVWNQNRTLESQKDFALSIKDKTPFASVLFAARKYKKELRSVWQESGEMIAEKLYG